MAGHAEVSRPSNRDKFLILHLFKCLNFSISDFILTNFSVGRLI